MENTYLKGFSAGILSTQPFNPWVSMWTEPRETVRQLMQQGQDGRVLLLGALAGVAQLLDGAVRGQLGDSALLSNILLVVVLLGAPTGLASLYLGSWLTAWTGRWLGGTADASALRVPIAWGGLPVVAGLVLGLVAFALVGSDLFTAPTARVGANPVVSLFMFGMIILTLWAVVLLAQSIAEAQGYASAWRGLGNLLLAGLTLIAVVVGLVVIVRPLIV
jgi:hypothetical protein